MKATLTLLCGALVSVSSSAFAQSAADPIIIHAVPGETQTVYVQAPPAPPAAGDATRWEGATTSVKLQVNVHLHVDAPGHPAPAEAPMVVPPPPVPQAPAWMPAPQRPLRLTVPLIAPRRRLGLPIALLAAGAVMTSTGALATSEDFDFVAAPVVGTMLLVSGVIALIAHNHRYRRQLVEYQERQVRGAAF